MLSYTYTHSDTLKSNVFLNGYMCQGTASADKSYSVKSLSSLLEDRSGKAKRNLEEVLPANRFSLNDFKNDKDFKLKSSGRLISNDKASLIYGRKNLQHQNREIVDLTDDIPSAEALLVPYPGKKRKGLNTENNLMKQEHSSNTKRLLSNSPSTFSSVMKSEDSLTSDNETRTNVRNGLVFPHKDRVVTSQGCVELLNEKNKGVRTTLAPCKNDEKKGSAFLIQVKYFIVMAIIIILTLEFEILFIRYLQLKSQMK